MALLQAFLYWPPASLLTTVIALAYFLAQVSGGINELKGNHVQYSKLLSRTSPAPKIGSKAGMCIIYSPALAFCAASFFLFPTPESSTNRFLLLRAAITLHFLKRLLEVCFVHKYSGEMTTETMSLCSVIYLVLASATVYSQYVSCGFPEPSTDLKLPGLVLFLVGIGGNLYHHYLLSRLRGEGEREYKIPEGGLFCVVACPHYLFEVLGFWGVTFIAQTVCAVGFAAGMGVYLAGRSHATRKWYVSKFEDFPAHVKAFIPFLF